jgi:pimeloyl-ACP methyl ester carboxylesterase
MRFCRTAALVVLTILGARTAQGQNGQHGNDDKEPLVLRDFGSFFVNGKVITTNFPNAPATGSPVPGRMVVNQMYVQYLIPQKINPKMYPVIMVHGSGHTGKTWETTPDGREGWATYFVRRGVPVYLVDQAGRARSGFDQTSINQAKFESNASLIPSPGLVKFTHVNAWSVFRFGPSPDVWWPDTQFPTEFLDQYLAQLVPNTEVTLDGGARVNTVNGMIALLDKIGPAIVMVHSQSGIFGSLTSIARPNLVQAFVDVEGTAACQLTPEQTTALAQVPTLVVAGDHGWPGEAFCRPLVNALKAAGGNAYFFATYEHLGRGNTHMLMLDKNNLQIADRIFGWLLTNAKKRDRR